MRFIKPHIIDWIYLIYKSFGESAIAGHESNRIMALAGSSLLRKQTALQQLLEEINFQRAKEMRQMLKDGEFVALSASP